MLLVYRLFDLVDRRDVIGGLRPSQPVVDSIASGDSSAQPP